MTTVNPEIDYSNLDDVLGFVIGEKLKKIHTALPGIVESYDPRTRRAVIQPAIDLLMTDGQTVPRAKINNVPVIHPNAGTMIVHMPIQRGDAVMLLVSERGMNSFKKAYGSSPPDLGSFMNLGDSVAIVGFGSQEAAPASDTAICIQDEGGSVYVSIEPEGEIEVVTPSSVRVECNSLDATVSANVTMRAGGSMTLRAGGTITLQASAIRMVNG